MKISMLYRLSNALRSLLIISILGMSGMGILHAQNMDIKADLAEEVESLETEQETEEQEGNESEKDYVEMGMCAEFVQFKTPYGNARFFSLTARELISIDPPPERF